MRRNVACARPIRRGCGFGSVGRRRAAPGGDRCARNGPCEREVRADLGRPRRPAPCLSAYAPSPARSWASRERHHVQSLEVTQTRGCRARGSQGRTRFGRATRLERSSVRANPAPGRVNQSSPTRSARAAASCALARAPVRATDRMVAEIGAVGEHSWPTEWARRLLASLFVGPCRGGERSRARRPRRPRVSGSPSRSSIRGSGDPSGSTAAVRRGVVERAWRPGARPRRDG